MTLEERLRTCSYCHITFTTKLEFSEHWARCPQRFSAGYIPWEDVGEFEKRFHVSLNYHQARALMANCDATLNDIAHLGESHEPLREALNKIATILHLRAH